MNKQPTKAKAPSTPYYMREDYKLRRRMKYSADAEYRRQCQTRARERVEALRAESPSVRAYRQELQHLAAALQKGIADCLVVRALFVPPAPVTKGRKPKVQLVTCVTPRELAKAMQRSPEVLTRWIDHGLVPAPTLQVHVRCGVTRAYDCKQAASIIARFAKVLNSARGHLKGPI